MRGSPTAAPSDAAQRLREAQALSDAGDLHAAESVLATLTSQERVPLDARLLHTRVLMRQERGGDALAAARAALARHPRDARAHALLGQLLLRLDDPAEALRHLCAAVAEFPAVAGLKALLAQALLMSGDTAAAAEAIDAALAIDGEDPDVKLRKIVILTAAQRLEDAQDARRALDDGTGELLALLRERVFALVRCGQKPLAAALCDMSCALLPAQAGPWLWKAELLLGEGREEEALAALKVSARSNEPMTLEDSFRHARAKGRALRGMKDSAAAMASFEEALALRPDDETSLRDLYVLHLQAGNGDAMREYGRRLSATVAKDLPPALAAGLARLRGQKPPPNIWNERTRWAWELADRSVWTKEAWLERLHWGQQADRLLRDWWLSGIERAGEIDALIDRSQATALDRLAPGARCLVVTTHMGPLAAGVRYMQTCGRPFRGFGFAGPDPVVEDEPPMRISAKGNAAFRELFRAIERGTLIGFAAESPESGQRLVLEFLGRRITIATFVPRIIHKLGTHSLWWHALWRDGRVVMELERLPDPAEGEPVELWCRRWADAYLARIARVMRGNPENLNLGHGIWRNVD